MWLFRVVDTGAIFDFSFLNRLFQDDCDLGSEVHYLPCKNYLIENVTISSFWIRELLFQFAQEPSTNLKVKYLVWTKGYLSLGPLKDVSIIPCPNMKNSFKLREVFLQTNWVFYKAFPWSSRRSHMLFSLAESKKARRRMEKNKQTNRSLFSKLVRHHFT